MTLSKAVNRFSIRIMDMRSPSDKVSVGDEVRQDTIVEDRKIQSYVADTKHAINSHNTTMRIHTTKKRHTSSKDRMSNTSALYPKSRPSNLTKDNNITKKITIMRSSTMTKSHLSSLTMLTIVRINRVRITETRSLLDKFTNKSNRKYLISNKFTRPSHNIINNSRKKQN